MDRQTSRTLDGQTDRQTSRTVDGQTMTNDRLGETACKMPTCKIPLVRKIEFKAYWTIYVLALLQKKVIEIEQGIESVTGKDY